MAEKNGYTNVKVFPEGFPVWAGAGNIVGVGVEWLSAKMASGEPYMLIDSRPFKGKFLKGTIPTAVSIPDSEFEAKQGMLPADKSVPLVFFCEGFT